MAWMKATPRTPNATARMVAVDSFANSSPRPVPTMRSKMDVMLLAPDWPKAMMIPAMMKEARNSSIAPPMLATIPSACLSQVAELRLQALNDCRQIRSEPATKDHGPSCRRSATRQRSARVRESAGCCPARCR